MSVHTRTQTHKGLNKQNYSAANWKREIEYQDLVLILETSKVMCIYPIINISLGEKMPDKDKENEKSEK